MTPRFVEWMLGFPDDWTAGESRGARLRMLGNAVQVQCAEFIGAQLLAQVGGAWGWNDPQPLEVGEA